MRRFVSPGACRQGVGARENLRLPFRDGTVEAQSSWRASDYRARVTSDLRVCTPVWLHCVVCAFRCSWDQEPPCEMAPGRATRSRRPRGPRDRTSLRAADAGAGRVGFFCTMKSQSSVCAAPFVRVAALWVSRTVHASTTPSISDVPRRSCSPAHNCRPLSLIFPFCQARPSQLSLFGAVSCLACWLSRHSTRTTPKATALDADATPCLLRSVLGSPSIFSGHREFASSLTTALAHGPCPLCPNENLEMPRWAR
jgi:hypothetical protein